MPEALWWAYGDLDRLADHYRAMAAHLTSIEPLLSDAGTWDDSPQLGDWLDPTAPPEDPMAAAADPSALARPTNSTVRSNTLCVVTTSPLSTVTRSAAPIPRKSLSRRPLCAHSFRSSRSVARIAAVR
ncbi:hypothetical protein [Rhodococcus sp. 14-2483-1-2]|uniref:alpha-L-rhamnosidase-related protein n=1 Tax=Rhodococcus sp. 14-2483-1-2 TaxID=2023147 RepID=UPI00338FA719